MRSIVFGAICLCSAFLAAVATVLVCGIAIGSLVTWVVPSIELGTATLCVLGSAMVFVSSTMGLIIFFMLDRLLQSGYRTAEVINANEDLDDDGTYRLDDDQFDALAEQVKEAILDRITFHDSWTRRKPKARR
jgi:hypothetical protein